MQARTLCKRLGKPPKGRENSEDNLPKKKKRHSFKCGFVPLLHLIKSKEMSGLILKDQDYVFAQARETCLGDTLNLVFLCFRIKTLSGILMPFYPSTHFDANVGKFSRDEYSKYLLLYLMSIFFNT